MAIKGYWRFNGNSNDASGNGNNGTDTNVTYSQASGRLNQGALFNGTSSLITKSTFSGMPAHGSNQTYSFWINCSNVTFSPYMEFYAFGEATNTTGKKGLRFRIDSGGHLTLYYPYVGGFSTQTYNNFFSSNTWVNLVIVMKSSTYTIYKNGEFYSSGTLTYPESVTLQTMNIGGDPYQARYFPGSIDEVKIDAIAWTNANAKNEYARVKGFF